MLKSFEEHIIILVFFLGFENKKYRDFSKVKKIYRGTSFPQKDRGNDWAFLELEKPLGKTYGTIPMRAYPPSFLSDQKVVLAGYSEDKLSMTGGATIDASCRITYGYNNILRHSCDAISGASGGPIFTVVENNIVLVGIHASSAPCYRDGQPIRCPKGVKYNHDIANYGVNAKSFLNGLRHLR